MVTSRAVWDPCVECKDDVEAYTAILTNCLSVFGNATSAVVEHIVDLSLKQHSMLVEGRLPNGSLPTNIVKHNAQAYLEGWDTWSEIGSLSPHFLNTQPLHYSLLDVRKPEVAKIYWESISSLLSETNLSFVATYINISALSGRIPPLARPIYQ